MLLPRSLIECHLPTGSRLSEINQLGVKQQDPRPTTTVMVPRSPLLKSSGSKSSAV